jgi:hypothetical protein
VSAASARSCSASNATSNPDARPRRMALRCRARARCSTAARR